MSDNTVESEKRDEVDAIRPLSEHEIHYIACEVDHNIRFLKRGASRVRWNNRTVAMLLATVGEKRETCDKLLAACEKARATIHRLVEDRFRSTTPQFILDTLDQLVKAIAKARGTK